MTIHHDKLAYGKLASDMEEMTEQQILEMLLSLETAEEEPTEKKDEEKK